MDIKNTLFGCIAIIFFGLTSCDFGEGDEPFPAYVKIDEITLNTDLATEGTASSKFTDVELFVDNQSVGVYELPTEIPVIAEGTTKLSVLPLFFLNGISATRFVSPVHTSFSVQKTLTPLETTIIEPVVEYRSDVKFELIGDFENSNFFEAETDTTFLSIINDEDFVFEGNRSAKVAISRDTHSGFRIGTIEAYDLDFTQPATIIELNYRCSSYFDAYLVSIDNGSGGLQVLEQDLIRISPKDEWNKIYINLTSALVNVQADFYEFGFKSELPDSLDSAEFYFDNIKLLYLEQ